MVEDAKMVIFKHWLYHSLIPGMDMHRLGFFIVISKPNITKEATLMIF